MAKRVVLAVAGAGKTYYVCNTLRPEKKNLILAYTHENIGNIKNELIKAYGVIPDLTEIMTYDAFVYRFIIRPYEPTIANHFWEKDFYGKDIVMAKPPAQRIKVKGNREIRNPIYVTKDKLGHYITKGGCYYCETLSELVMQVKNGSESLIKKAAKALNKFYDEIFIDEFQDFREFDFDVIMALAKNVDNVLMVGDYYQHSVSGQNNSGRPFKKRNSDLSYNEFVQLLTDNKFFVDETTLKKSRRCGKQICDYVKSKLAIDIESNCDNDGEVIWLEKNIHDVLGDDSIVKLVYNDAKKFSFHAVNWSYSKGDTMDSVCVILTDSFSDMKNDSFSCRGIATQTINRLYVAMTRTKGDLYLLDSKDFKKVKSSYLKINE